MRWLNGEYLKAMSAEDFEKVATPWIEKAIDGKDYDVKELASLMQTRVDILSEIPENLLSSMSSESTISICTCIKNESRQGGCFEGG